MRTKQRTARIVGVLFLTAMVASLAGGIWLESFLAAPDYLTSLSANQTQVMIGVLLELVNGLAVVGIAVMMFPIFKVYDEALALGYVALRIIEAVVAVAAVTIPLTLVALSREIAGAGAPDATYVQLLGASFLAVRAHLAGLLLALFFGLAALLFYYLLYRWKLVPRWLSAWGFLGVALVLAWNLLEAFGISISIGIVLALPMILNEIFLAIWLIVKGFDSPAEVSEAA